MTPAYERHGAGSVMSADEAAEKRKQVRGFWHRCDYATGTPAARYLARRGLPWLTTHNHVRYRADTSHPGGGRLPAVVWLVHDAAGNIAAVLLGLPGWAAVSCGNLGANMALPAGVRRVTIAADPDPPGQRAAAKAARRWRAEGRSVRLATPDTPGQDFADLLLARIQHTGGAAHG